MQATMALEGTMRMKGWIQEGDGNADVLKLREVAKPEISDDRILVRVKASSVNAADYHAMHGGAIVSMVGKFMRQPPAPPVRGSDVSGIVEAVGKNVTALRPGDEVFGTARGSWAEYATGTERSLMNKPTRLSFAEAGAIGIAATTALQGLRDKGQLKAGQRVLIYGAGGGVGTFAVQIAKALGAHVTAVTGPRNIDLVRTLGADVLIDYSKDDVAKRTERYDVVYDVAATRSLGTLRRLLRPGGILVCAGASKSGGMAGIMVRLISAQIRSRVFKQRIVFYVASIRRDDFAFIAQLAEAGTLRPAIDRTYPLSEAREAVRYAENGEARAKVVITAD